MSRPLTPAVLLVLAATLATSLALPAMAAASPHLPTPVLGLLGFDIGDLVEKVIRSLVDLVVPDFASQWAATFTTWLVALPNPADWSHYAHLNAFRRELTAVGFGLLGVSLTASVLQLCFGSGGAFHGADALKRTVLAAGVLVFYPQLLGHAVTGVNLLTATAMKHEAVRDGLDKALGTALLLGAVTGGLSLGLAVAAAMASLFFIAALLVMKIGLTAALAVLMLSGAVVWGLYPLMPWLGRAWLSGLCAATAIPLAWALIFSAAALLSADALQWSTPGGTSSDAPQWLEQIIKPFSAAACFWLAYKAPSFLVSTLRIAGVSVSGVIGGPVAGRGGAAGSAGRGGRAERALRTATQTNRDRFRALTSRSRDRMTNANGTKRQAVRRTGARATVAVGRRSTPAAAGRGSAPAKAQPGRRTPMRVAARVAAAPKRANDWWRGLPAEGAALRQAATPSSPTARATPRTGADSSRPAGQTPPSRGASASARPGTAAVAGAAAGPARRSRKPRPSEAAERSRASSRAGGSASAPRRAPATGPRPAQPPRPGGTGTSRSAPKPARGTSPRPSARPASSPPASRPPSRGPAAKSVKTPKRSTPAPAPAAASSSPRPAPAPRRRPNS